MSHYCILLETGGLSELDMDSTEQLMKLRLAVGYLGESFAYAWWPTRFYEDSSRLFLDPVFARTSFLARYHAVNEAARLLHDEFLNVGCYHLFRLPEEVEQDLHKLVQRYQAEGSIPEFVHSKESAISVLATQSGESKVNSIGPTSIGIISDLRSHSTISSFASAYLNAFTQNAKTYPYLTG